MWYCAGKRGVEVIEGMSARHAGRCQYGRVRLAPAARLPPCQKRGCCGGYRIRHASKLVAARTNSHLEVVGVLLSRQERGKCGKNVRGQEVRVLRPGASRRKGSGRAAAKPRPSQRPLATREPRGQAGHQERRGAGGSHAWRAPRAPRGSHPDVESEDGDHLVLGAAHQRVVLGEQGAERQAQHAGHNQAAAADGHGSQPTRANRALTHWNRAEQY